MCPTYYTPAETDVLLSQYNGGDKAAILAALPGRTWHSIEMRASNLGLRRKGRKLSDKELALLDQRYATMPKKELLLLFPQITEHSLAKIAARRGLRKAEKVKVVPVVKVQLARPPKPPKPPKPEVKLPTKRALKIPNANAQRAMMEKKKRVDVPITAEEFKARRIPMYSKEWWSFTNQGYRGWAEYIAKQQAPC